MPGPIIGKWLIIFGVILAAVGALFYFGLLPGKLGQMPGDINVKRDGYSIHILIGTGIILSIIITLLLNIILRIRH
jgi:hypothetical protein